MTTIDSANYLSVLRRSIVAREKKERTLTEAERRRLDHFNEVSDELVAQGYRRTDLRINMVTANVVSIVGAIALLAICIAALSVCA